MLDAPLDPQNSTSIVTALSPAQLTVGFALEPNQVIDLISHMLNASVVVASATWSFKP